MKTIIKVAIPIVFMIVFVQMSVAQEQTKGLTYDASEKGVPPNNVSHITDKNATKFAGTWTWKDDNDEFKLILINDIHNYGSIQKPLMVDMLKGGYQYIKNGKEISNTLKNYSITGSTSGETTTIFIMIANEQTQKSREFILTYIDKSKIKLELSKRVHEGVRLNDRDLIMPNDIILTKSN